MEIFGLIALSLALLGWTGYPIINKRPSLRKSMWPLWVFFIVGEAFAIAALVIGSPPLDHALALAASANFPIFLFFYFFMMRIPRAAGRPEIGQAIPKFSLTGESGKPVSPDDYSGKGPVLLVFFRGFW